MYLPTQLDGIVLYRLEVEADETWSFVGKKANCQWIWLALDATTRQVIAFHVGDRSRQSAQQLLQNIPEVYRHSATFHTDLYAVYQGVIPSAQHRSHIRTVQLLSLQHLGFLFRIFPAEMFTGLESPQGRGRI